MTEAHGLKKGVRAEDREATMEKELKEAIEVIEATGMCEATGLTSQGDLQSSVQTGWTAQTGKMFEMFESGVSVSDCKKDTMVPSHLESNRPLISSVRIDNTMVLIFEMPRHRDNREERPHLCDVDRLKSCKESQHQMAAAIGAVNVVAKVALRLLPGKL